MLAVSAGWADVVNTQAQTSNMPEGKVGGSRNIEVVGHLPLGGYFRVMDAEIGQEMSRPYAYVSQSRDRPGFSIIDLHDLDHIKVLYRWSIENPELHTGTGGMDGKYVKMQTKAGTKYYYIQSVQFGNSGPDADLGAVVVDVTGLPDTSKIKVVARITYPEAPGGFHNIFAYKHSDGRVLLFATVSGSHANVYDLAKVLAGDPNHGLIGQVPVPPGTFMKEALPGFSPIATAMTGYHDFYVGYDPATHQDKFYGAGGGGYYVFDVTKPESPKLITSIVGAAGVSWGHTITPTPDGQFVVTETEYQWAPLRIFDLRPGLEGKIPAVTQPVSVWNSDWNDLAHNHEIRWPYVFVSAYEDGLQIFNMQDPSKPHTVAWYYTCECAHNVGYGGLPEWSGKTIYNGAFGIDVRNADGLIMITDSNTGVWFFRLEGFSGWDGRDWGMPNISSAQDWDNGPPGASAAAVKQVSRTP
jgi:hypothetical protein